MRGLLAALAAATAIAVGCSVPSDEVASLIDPEDLPDQLRTDLTSTTTVQIDSPFENPIDLYLIVPVGERHVVVPVRREIHPAADLYARLSLLFVPDMQAEEDFEREYQNALASLQLIRAEVNDNRIAVIDIVSTDVDGNVLALDNDALRDAAAQLVYTATNFDDIDAVRLLYDGERVNLPTQSDEGDTDRVITPADYPLYDPETENERLDLPSAGQTDTSDTATTTQAKGETDTSKTATTTQATGETDTSKTARTTQAKNVRATRSKS